MNPDAFRSGPFVAEHVHGVDPEQVQPNGVDLTVQEVLEPRQTGAIRRDGKEIGERRPVATRHAPDGAPYWRLGAIDGASGNAFVVKYGQRLSVPKGHVGFVLPRSSLLRNGVTLETAVWDAGYEGVGEGLLLTPVPIEIEQAARIGQFVLARADHEGFYDGDYQNEGVGGEDA